MSLLSNILQRICAPFAALKRQYIPLLAVYFAAGFSGLDAVTRTFFVKNQLSLSAEDLIGLSIWIGLPWSIKMVFGSIIDGIAIFGNNRKSYIYLGSIMSIIGSLLMIDLATIRTVTNYLGEYGLLLASGLLTTCGVVIADIVADTMAIELVPKDDKYDYNLGMVQVLSRLALSVGSVLAATLTGFVASKYNPATVFAIAAFVPIISIVGAFIVKLNEQISNKQLDKKILFGGLLFGLFCVLDGMIFKENAQLILFLVSSVVITTMLWSIVKDMEVNARTAFILASTAIFLFRVVPGIGPSIDWWYIEVLKFDEQFMGLIRIIMNVSALVALWLLADTITGSSIRGVMIALTIIGTLLSLPEILIYYGAHEVIGVTPKQMLLTSSALVAPLGGISMIPLGVLIAKNAPPHKRAIYISLTASFMNIALVGGDVITKYLNQIFVVTRTDFSQLGKLMITSLVISTVLSIVGIMFLRKEK